MLNNPRKREIFIGEVVSKLQFLEQAQLKASCFPFQGAFNER
jgi:hypothetical protein